MRLRKWTVIAATVVLILAVLAWFGYYALMGPMYRPGDLRAGRGLREPLQPPSQAGVGPHMWKVASDIELYHFEDGSGEDVLTVHGGPGFPHHTSWKANAALADRYRFIYYHQRGCGKSTRPIMALQGNNTYQSMQTLNSTLGLGAQVGDIERIRRILGHDKLILAGHSFGAFIAALYAAEFPEHVKALVLVSPACLTVLPNPDGDLFALMRTKLPPEMLPEYDRFYAQYFDFNSQLKVNEQQLAALHRRFGVFYLAAAPAGPPALDPSGVVDNGGFMPLAVFLSMGKHHDYSAALHAVTAPVLVIHGGKDLQPRAWSESFARLFTRHRFVEIAGAGHFSFEDHPAEFAGAVRGFLSKL